MKVLLHFFFLMALAVICPAQSLKVMTYNIRYDTPADSINQWPKRMHKVVDLIRKYDPDILGIQEAIHHQVTDLLKNFPDYNYIGVGRDDGKTKGEYSAILFKKDRFSVLKQNTFWLSSQPEIPGSKGWDAAITRVATWGRFMDTKTQRTIFVMNTHFDHIGKEARAKSAELLKQKVYELGSDLPVIVTGDFNCTREQSPYAAIMKTDGIALVDPSPSPSVGTACGFKVNERSCNAIDYIFHSAQWTTTGYTVIQDNDGKYYPSDHLPVLATLHLKN
jgi:endonuclease/exonuclease/phosphatase family metal-dependent hydrolase